MEGSAKRLAESFGNGGLADFCCHTINLPARALDLDYPEKIVVNMQDGKQIADKAAVEFHFPARGNLPSVTLHWQGSGKPPAEAIQPLADVYGDKMPSGLMIIGEKGCIYTSRWNTGGLIRHLWEHDDLSRDPIQRRAIWFGCFNRRAGVICWNAVVAFDLELA